MSFLPLLDQGLSVQDTSGAEPAGAGAKMQRILAKPVPDAADFWWLLSEASLPFLELSARRSRQIALRHFGKTIGLYAPLYLANYCDNECVYCGFKASNRIDRRQLSLAEVDAEARTISREGIRHILLLTGGSRAKTSLEYVSECIAVCRRYFTSVSLEMFPVSQAEYAGLVAAGAEGLVLYQETYDRERYRTVHPRGQKSDFEFRLQAAEAACAAGMRQVTVGALLGLSDFQPDAYWAGRHAAYLQHRYPEVEIGVAVPRLRPQVGDFQPAQEVTDRQIVQMICAIRMLLPRCGITVSTREQPNFRDHCIALGVTRLSAGSRTQVGGYSQQHPTSGQFEIADERSVAQISEMIRRHGYQPVFNDWQLIAAGTGQGTGPV